MRLMTRLLDMGCMLEVSLWPSWAALEDAHGADLEKRDIYTEQVPKNIILLGTHLLKLCRITRSQLLR